jgi:hypothetical protein
MISLSSLLNEVLVNDYIKQIEPLIKNINWEKNSDFKEIRDRALITINQIKDISTYKGEGLAMGRLKELKNISNK